MRPAVFDGIIDAQNHAEAVMRAIDTPAQMHLA